MESEIYNEIADSKYKRVESEADIVDWLEVNNRYNRNNGIMA